MQRFLERHQDRIVGVLSGFDRLLFRGTLRSISYLTGIIWPPGVPVATVAVGSLDVPALTVLGVGGTGGIIGSIAVALGGALLILWGARKIKG